MLRIYASFFALLWINFSLPRNLSADFQFDLAIAGRGRVLVDAGGGPPTTYSSTPPSSLSVTGDQAKLVALPKSYVADAPPSSITIQAGSDLTLTLTNTELGSKFVEWTGSFVPSVNPNNPQTQDPTGRDYFIYQPSNPLEVKNIQANFSSDIADVEIDSIEFSFDGQNTWIAASQWNFTGDDDPLNPSLFGDTQIRLNWSDLAGHIVLDQLTPVDLRIFDKTGTEFLSGFDFTVSSSAVPEPSSFVMLSLTVAGYFGFRRRKRKLKQSDLGLTLKL